MSSNTSTQLEWVASRVGVGIFLERGLDATAEVGVALGAANRQRVAKEGECVVGASGGIPDIQFVKLTARNRVANQLDPAIAGERELVLSVHRRVGGFGYNCGPRTIATVCRVVGDLEAVGRERTCEVSTTAANSGEVIAESNENLAWTRPEIDGNPVSGSSSPCTGRYDVVAVTAIVHLAVVARAVNRLAARNMRH